MSTARLMLYRQGRAPEPILLGDAAVQIGRDRQNDIAIDDPQVSAFHARIEPSSEGYEIADAGSTNGVFVNGRRLERPQRLMAGDRVQLGATSIVFTEDEDEGSTTHILQIKRQ